MTGFKYKLLAVMQHVVILNHSEVLLLRYSDYWGEEVEGLWGLPGGHYQSGDPVSDLLREVREETGIILSGSKLSLLKVYAVPFPDGYERFGVFYLCDLGTAAKPKVTLSHEHTAFLWAGAGELSSLKMIGPYHRQIVEDVLKGLSDKKRGGE